MQLNFQKKPWQEQLTALDSTKKKKVLFNVSNTIEIMFFSNFTAYQQFPEPELIKKLQKEDYLIYINQTGSAEIKSKHKGVKYIDIQE